MIVDDITIRVTAGNGGQGAVAFNKTIMALGPTGARGGNGGSIYFEGISDLTALNRLRFAKNFKAGSGKNGGHHLNDGNDGEDLTIKVPVGTVIHNLVTKQDFEIVKVGEKLLVAQGGKGGRGNFHFRSSTNTSPHQFQKGLPGDKFRLRLELKLIADVGLIGLPNAGKSSLLNELTAAKSKVANYPFTTLEPNLGVYYDLILADIPGIIEGASSGKGLGLKFLRHVERTKILMHLVSAESEDPARDYKTIREEMGAHNKELLNKKEYLFLSKADLLPPKELKSRLSALKKLNKDVLPLSIHDWDSLEKVKKILNETAKEK